MWQVEARGQSGFEHGLTGPHTDRPTVRLDPNRVLLRAHGSTFDIRLD
jgi:hypothetical protein